MEINEIKDTLKSRRLELNLTLLDVAKAVGVSEATVSRWESGNIVNMKHSRIAALAKVLKISPSVIMGWDDESETKLSKKDEKEIDLILENTRNQLLTQEGLLFDGEPASEEAIQSILDAMQIGMEMAKKRNKEKYTPNKYKK